METQPEAAMPPAGIPVSDFDPFAPEALTDPYPGHQRLRDCGPVVWLARYNVFALARFENVRAALLDHETFLSGRGVGLSDFAKEKPWRPPSLLLEADPPMHDRMRSIMNRVMPPSSLKALEPVWLEHARHLAGELADRGKFDAVSDLAEIYPLMVFPDAVGLMEEGREHLLVYAAAVFNAFGPRNEHFEEGERAAIGAIPWIAEACKRCNLAPGGWGRAIYEAADRGECSEDEAGRLVRSLLSAGVDTTVNGIASLIHALTQFPDQWRLLCADPRLARRAVEESLRWDSTVQTFFRTTARKVDVGGATIPEGAKVLLFLGAANRDPRKWSDPESFDILRLTSGHVGFGAGIHQCLGQMIARFEMQLLLIALAERIAALKPAGPIVRRCNNTLHAIASLPVEVTPRSLGT